MKTSWYASRGSTAMSVEWCGDQSKTNSGLKQTLCPKGWARNSHKKPEPIWFFAGLGVMNNQQTALANREWRIASPVYDSRRQVAASVATHHGLDVGQPVFDVCRA